MQKIYLAGRLPETTGLLHGASHAGTDKLNTNNIAEEN